MYGWRASEVLGKPLPSVSDETRTDSDGLRARLLAGETFRHEARRRLRDGGAIDINAFLAPLRDGTGTIDGIIAVVADVTEHKRAESALRESEQRFRAIFDHAGVGITMRPAHDRSHPWTEVNEEFCRLLGYTRDELLRLSTAEITPADQEASAIHDN